MSNFQRISVKEVIVVEGRDDTTAVLAAVDGMTIETHGFGIKRQTWQLIEKAYEEKGIIILTDPDFSGEEIRRKLTERFPNAGQAYLPRKSAEKKGDIGVENASPQDIAEALSKAKYTEEEITPVFSYEDLYAAGLTGRSDSKERREKIGALLGIGYGNSKTMLKKLNQFGIKYSQFQAALEKL